MKANRMNMALLLAAVASAVSPQVNVQARSATTEARTPAENTRQAQPRPQLPSAQSSPFFGWGPQGSRGSQRKRGPGWTQAHVKRMAAKKRNQQRHRAACRG
jgi:hypothetical protein